jgi:hypothetical protein
MQVDERVKTLWLANHERAKTLAAEILSQAVNPFGEECLKTVAICLQPNDLAELINTLPESWPIFVKLNPQLLTYSESWYALTGHESELSDILDSDSVQPLFLSQILPHLTAIQERHFVERLHRRFGAELTRALLRFFALHTVDFGTRSVWAKVLSDDQATVAESIFPFEGNRSVITTALEFLNPTSRAVHDMPAQNWVTLAETEGQCADTHTSDVMSFLLAYAFTEPAVEASRVVIFAFPIVHRAAASNTLSYHGWDRLRDLAPSLSRWREWDRCERLRAALVDNFIRKGWPVSDFLAALKDKETFQAVVEYCDSEKKGRRFLESVHTQIKRNSQIATPDQTQVLKDYDGLWW